MKKQTEANENDSEAGRLEVAIRTLMASRVRQAMARAGLNQTSLAERIGLDQGSVSRYLRGKVDITLPVLARIAVATGHPHEYFMWRFREDVSTLAKIEKLVPVEGWGALTAPDHTLWAA